MVLVVDLILLKASISSSILNFHESIKINRSNQINLPLYFLYFSYFCRVAREQDNTIFPYLYCLALVNSGKFFSCFGLFSQYKNYYCLVLKFLIISFLITPVWRFGFKNFLNNRLAYHFTSR